MKLVGSESVSALLSASSGPRGKRSRPGIVVARKTGGGIKVGVRIVFLAAAKRGSLSALR